MPDNSPDLLFELLNDFFTQLLSAGESESMDNLIELDLTFSQVRMLFALAQHGEPLPINEVAERLRLSVAAAGRNVDQLVKLGLVVRREDERDRRVKRVSLSEAGHKVANQHIECKRDQLRRFAWRVPESERTRLIEALQPILAGESLRELNQEIFG
ncbi:MULTISPECIES: MarR family winged helix-turn-helix transcriptional regulator [Rhodococcus]|uniref:Possible transcriptional regulator, MarR family n=1 Tax=Rhodococcus wratislaviensis TaxID=44752 RepID=A0A402BXG8_RHOWR|nr:MULTISPECIES: MarR family transcriptional regulator [Rhodococcus]MDF3304326.1 MarR family transcriptional regulator [Rhodococcus sp. T2V]QSE79455.1 MarR family transcriptional regulator [Rhodococcus koreensis]QYB05945.1 MarR family transcriptional regulator [Rhodococcus sp. USK10]GCE36080.1 possible transcriptional regulator, MarR family [Rhodococcus wratislaviensis]